MTLSAGARTKLENQLGNWVGKELSDQVDSGGNPVADNVATLGALTDLAAASVAATGTPDCDAAAVNAGIDAVIADVQADIDTLQAKIDAVIDALTSAGVMASS